MWLLTAGNSVPNGEETKMATEGIKIEGGEMIMWQNAYGLARRSAKVGSPSLNAFGVRMELITSAVEEGRKNIFKVWREEKV